MIGSGYLQDINVPNSHPRKPSQVGPDSTQKQWMIILKRRVSFLPAINQSPTELDTVHEVLQQVKRKTEILNVQSADLVLDHAIFTKALNILNEPTNEDLKASINIRMGGFHACCIFLAVIGKRFASGGLRNIVIESGLVGSGTIEAVFKGKHYNYGLRMIKIVSEALFR